LFKSWISKPEKKKKKERKEKKQVANERKRAKRKVAVPRWVTSLIANHPMTCFSGWE